ncbi:MAG: hypothetical protein ACI4WG_02090 [Erysipelotrichaceae bacterium]
MGNSATKDFVAYEYLSIDVLAEKEPLYMDCYENFGWILVNTKSFGLVDKDDYYINNNSKRKRLVNLKFKRDREIPNKSKIVLLQNKCESSLKKINALEKEPANKGSIYASLNAFVGTIFTAISVFAVSNVKPNYVITAIFGAVGLILWFLSYTIYKKIKLKQEQINASLIEEEYNIVYDCCQQSQILLKG